MNTQPLSPSTGKLVVSIQSDRETKVGFVASLHSASTVSTRSNGQSLGDDRRRTIGNAAKSDATQVKP